MNALFTQTENEKQETIVSRIDDIRRFIKNLKSFFLEFHYICDSHYKTSAKPVKTLQNSFPSYGNESIFMILTLSADNFEMFNKNLSLSTNEFQLNYSNKIEEYLEKLNFQKKIIFDNISIGLKNFNSSKAHFRRIKQKYEKHFSIAEQAKTSTEKLQNDSSSKYNYDLIDKSKSKSLSCYEYVLSLEESLKNSIEKFKDEQENFNKILIESYNNLKVYY